MWQKLINWLEQIQFQCTFKKYFGISCPGCGFQSALVELLRGNIWESVKIYPALLPILITLVSFFIQLKVQSKSLVTIMKLSFYLSLILIFGNYFLKQILS
ncbi:DUF2752 domain-containing protein [Marinifilum sp.]|uniref:DUF2752 domain-containing protein n=1 Tax=Marinifilum sp. TaxID=2033137 RepID=UPI003BABFC2B